MAILRARARFLGAAAFLVAVAPTSADAQCPDGSPPPCSSAPRRVQRVAVTPPSVAARRRTFLVLPFRNLTRSPEHDWLVEGSPVLISDALSRADSLTVIPDERLYPALERAGLAPGEVMDLARVRRVAEETGGWTAVTGEILALGNRLRVSARAFDVVSNAEMMRAVEEAAATEDVRTIYERLGTRLVRATGTAGAAANLASTTTKSVEAYRAFVRGVSHQNRSEVRRARDAFLEAVRLDSTYAQAYAKLAETESNVDPRQITNLQSPLYRYSARAAALAANLPPKNREVVLAMNDFLSGRFGAARARVENLVAADSLHVDALERLAGIEIFDPVLVDRGGSRRPRGSMNRGLALSKRVLELDPSRHQLYGSLVQTYLLLGGLAPGYTLGYAAEAASLPAMLATPPAMTFVPLLRDTIELVPGDSMRTIPPDTVSAAQRRALDAARQWVMRWIDVGKGQAEPHLWASRVHSQAGDFDAALRALDVADSLGVETGLENVPARRMSLLARLGRYKEGRAIADSLWGERAFDNAAQNAYWFEGAGWAHTLYVLDGQYARADSMVRMFATAFAPAALANPDLTAEGMAVLFLTGSIRQFFQEPPAVRAAVLQRIIADAGTLAPSSLTRRMLQFHAYLILRDTAVSARPAIAMEVVQLASRVVESGEHDFALQLAAVARMDTVARRTLEALPWYTRAEEAERAERAGMERMFRPVKAVVTDSAASFHWQVTGNQFRWYRPLTVGGNPDFLWEGTFTLAEGEYEVLADVSPRPGSVPTAGDLASLVRSAFPALHQITSPDTTVPHRILSRTAVRLEMEPGGFRMALREPRIVAALRRQRPATVRMEFRPCVANCAPVSIPLTYP